MPTTENIRTSNFDLEAAPLELDQLIHEQVQLVMRDSTPLVINALEILAASPTSLPIKVLAELSGASEAALIEHLKQVNSVKWDVQKQRLEYVDDMVRGCVRKQSGERIKDIIQDLQKHIQTNHPNEDLLLTLLFKEVQDYEGLQNTLVPREIIGTIDTTRDMSNVMRRLRLASEMALEKGHTEDLVKWTLGITVARSFIEHAASSHEIEALLAIGDSKNALGKAYLIPETSSKVRLLAKAYTAMKDKGDRVQKEALDELATMVDSMDLHTFDKETVFEIAIDLFPILPEVAFSLLEKVTGYSQKRSVIEVAIKAIEDGARESSRNVTANVKHEVNLGHIAQILSSWLNGLPLSKLLEELRSVENTQAKEYIIRQWCRQNREDSEVAKAIDSWLDVVIDDRDFVILLRSLRHISEVVVHVPLTDRRRLIARLQGPEINALDSPEEEWARFHLSIAEGMFETDKKKAITKIREVHRRICESTVDLDVKAFCLSRLWVTVKKLYPEESEWISDIHTQFGETFYPMLRGSAEQYEAAIGSILTLVEIDPIDALTLALELNTHSRRTKAVKAVLTLTLRKRGNQDLIEFIREALNVLEKTHRDSVLVRVTSELNARESKLASQNLDTLLEYAQKIGDPTLKAQTLSHLASLLHIASSDKAVVIMEEAIESWRKEEDLKLVLSVGFRLVQDMAKLDIDKAGLLYEEVQNLKFQPGSILAVGELGVIFNEILELAIRAVTRDDLGEGKQEIEHLKEFIHKIPARAIRIRLFAMLAASAYRVDRKEYADELVRTQIIQEIEWMQPDFNFSHIGLEKLEGILTQKGGDLVLDGQILYKSKPDDNGLRFKTLSKYINTFVEARGQTSARRFQVYSIRNQEFQHDYNESVLFCLPVIFECDFSVAKALADALPFPAKDWAWHSSVFWSLSHSFLGDHHVAPDNPQIQNDNTRLRNTLKAAAEIEHDMLLYQAISAIANIVKVSMGKLDLTQALDILSHLDELAMALPAKSQENIKHKGYSVIAQAIIHGVRSVIFHSKYYRSSRAGYCAKKYMGEQWRKICQEAEAIPNIADRVFVIALIAPEIAKYYTKDRSIARELLNKAESEIENIPSLLDRADRLQTVADSWNALGDKSKAEVICDHVFELINQLEGASADDRLRLLVQAAYKVKADFADDLTSRLDSRLPNRIMHPAELALEVEKLRHNPSKIRELQSDKTTLEGIVMRQAAKKLLEDFATGRGVSESPTVLSDWLINAGLHQSRISIDALHWVVESLHRMTLYASAQNQLGIFLQNAQLTYELARWVSNKKGEGIPKQIQDSFPGLNAKCVTFRRGEVEKAKRWMEEWLTENVKGYLKICDPYFGIEQFEYFKYVPVDCTILVITTDKDNSMKGDPAEIKSEVEQYWNSLTNRALPRTQLMIIPKALKERFHDRLIISSDSGLDIGPSLNGLGTSFQKIAVLSEEDAKEQERDYLTRMLDIGTWFMEGVRPIIFHLGE